MGWDEGEVSSQTLIHCRRIVGSVSVCIFLLMHTYTLLHTQTIYGRFVVCSSDKSIGCPPSLTSSVAANLWPAYEDLFDETEEYALGVLMDQWVELCCYDDRIFQKVGKQFTGIKFCRLK